MNAEKRLEYLATVLDYAGSIQMMKLDGKDTPIVRINSNDPVRAGMFAKEFGGELNHHKSGMHVFRRSHGHAVEIVRRVRPFLLLSAEIADRVLAWTPVKPRGPATPIMVPCPNACGRMKTYRAKHCLQCYLDAERKKRGAYQPVPNSPNVTVHRIR